MPKKGLVHIYTGNGKGKTTAAFGLAVRACGCGMKVAVYQFMKGAGPESGELKSCRRFAKKVSIVRFKQVHPCFWPSYIKKDQKLRKKLITGLKAELKNSLEKVASEMRKKKYDMCILDESISAVSEGFLKAGDILRLIKSRPGRTELVLTGRGACASLVKAADYVSEIKDIKHPYRKGVKARKGVEY